MILHRGKKMKKRVCRTCKIFVEEDLCPICKKASFSESWQGQVSIMDPANSQIAKQMKFVKEGDYCIKVKR